MAAPSEIPVYLFEDFTLDPQRRTLTKDGRPLALGSRALEILIALVERPGDVLSKEYLVSRAWPRTFVEDSSLRVNIAALRRALGDGRRLVANVPGRGYTFVAAVSTQLRPSPAAAGEPAAVFDAPLPRLLPKLLGRGATLAVLAGMLESRPVVTLVGPGGVGKTSLARQVLAAAGHDFEAGGRFVDLSACRPGSVSEVVAADLGWPRASPFAEGRLASMLLVLDNCEHVLEDAALFVEQLLTRAPSMKVLCTSREPLNVAGEHVLRLPPLAVPPAQVGTLAEALKFPAAELFIERARAASDATSFTDADVPDLRALCEQLDGLPLAIELAAARVSTLGLKGLLSRAPDRLSLLTRGRRTAMPRHQSLRALIDWSYVLLDDDERRVLRGLSLLHAPFTLTSAKAIAATPAGAASVEELVLRLVDKSLLASHAHTQSTQDGACFRMPASLRLYAAELLAASPEHGDTRRRHGHELLRRLSAADAANVAEIPAVRDLLAELTAALDWAVRDAGDMALGARLLHASLPWLRVLGRLDDFRGQMALAIAAVHADPARFPTEAWARIEADFDLVLVPSPGVGGVAPAAGDMRRQAPSLPARDADSLAQGDLRGL